ncbi:MAG: T9SS type A sorting domain-containing protein, partial [Bacteroidales bacterium]|nr:T9SS type A sorting domain-containing protein [Bacteroidales bacterium]
PGQTNNDDICTEDKVRWEFGTGGAPTMVGSGEIGYRFYAGGDSYYRIENMYPNFGLPYAVKTAIIRAPSPSLRHQKENGEVYYDSMPLYFKLYNSSKVAAQQVIGDLTSETSGYVDVVYPRNPENYTAITNTVLVAAHCNEKGELSIDYPKAEFQNIPASQRLGENFCVSVMFPIEWDEEGDSIVDPAWNATLITLGYQNGEDKISEEPHSVYIVHDFQRTTHFWTNGRPASGKRWPDMIRDSLMQPNARYAIIPMDASGSTGEPYMWFYYTEASALQSANKADRYVQLSPVPAVDYVNFSSYADMSRIEIYSLGGQLVKAVNVSGDTYRLDLTGINSGMYVARIYSEKGISSKKLIVR